jgi:hypothetical protein
MTTYEQFDLLLSGAQALAVFVGFFYTHRQLRLVQIDLKNSVELAGRQQAMELMARYAAPEAAERRNGLRTDATKQQNYHECCALLNSLEEIAIARKHNIANQTILKDAFATAVRGWLDKDFIHAALRQAREKDKARYENVIDLYFTWGGDNPKMKQIRPVADLETK